MNSQTQNFNQFQQHRQRLGRARLEIVPLIDIMFLLVAFFMIVSISMVVQKGIFVDLSPAETGEDSDQQDTLTVSVDSNGALYLNKDEIDRDALLTALNDAANEDRDRSVILNADEMARHRAVITALDTIRKSGLHNIVFSVEPESE